MRIINLSDLNHEWNWLRDEFKNTNQEWFHYSSKSVRLPKMLPRKDSLSKAIAAFRATCKAKRGNSVLVSHGPRSAFYGASLAEIICPHIPHLAYSFNFTHLPKGMQRKLMVKSYGNVNKFVTYSNVERTLYSDYFDIPIGSIDMLHWSVHKPKLDLLAEPMEAGRYICALGSQGRDYKTLFTAIKKLQHIKLVVVTDAANIENLEIPDNVKIYTNIPLSQAQNILAFSQFMVLPLRDGQVPCGHVTIVSGMFFEKAILVTNSVGVHDYIQDEKTGLFFEPKNTNDLSRKIENLWDDASITTALGIAALEFADVHCTEKTVVNYFSNFLNHVL